MKLIRYALWGTLLALAGAPPALSEERATPRIVGGAVAAEGAWPWQVGLLFSDQQNNYIAQFCGGTLINPNWVLTAAHCVHDVVQPGPTPPSELDILVGTNRLDGTGTRIRAAAIFIDPNYDPVTSNRDVAVVRLKQSAPQETMGVLTLGLEPTLAAPGTLTTVTGWGSLRDPVPLYPVRLREAQVPLVGTATCNAPDSYDGAVTQNMICAGFPQGGKDTCFGDSGGPLLVPSGDGWLLAGITSWGEGCALPDFPGVYTRVPRFVGWLRDIMHDPSRRAIAPTPVGPVGNTDAIRPTFVWNAVADATSYRLRVNDAMPGRALETIVRSGQAGCGLGVGTCELTSPVDLAPGAVTWGLAAINNAGLGGGFSALFNITGAPPQVALIGPFGEISDPEPLFRWGAAARATRYRLRIEDGNGAVRDERWISAQEAGCPTMVGECAVQSPIPLAQGSAVWRVRGSNVNGKGAWSLPGHLTVEPTAPPAQVALVAAQSAVRSAGSGFTWHASRGADAYRLVVLDEQAGALVDRRIAAGEAGCGSGDGLCRFGLAGGLPQGAVSWWIRPYGATGEGPIAGAAID